MTFFPLNRIFPVSWPTDLELQENDEWQKGPRIKKPDLEALEEEAKGEGVVLDLSAVLDVRPRQRWTATPPSTPGYWWCRVPGHQAKVVEVYRISLGLRMASSEFGAVDLPAKGLQWGSLPISEPAEPR